MGRSEARRPAAAALLIGLVAAASPAAALDAVMQGLDKVTARVSSFTAPLNQPVRFGTLEIIARNCVRRPPEEPPETAGYIEIFEVKPDLPKQRVFAGWMFVSSPGLNPVEHPVYDVWLKDCK